MIGLPGFLLKRCNPDVLTCIANLLNDEVVHIVPTLRRGNAAPDAPAFRANLH